MTRLIQPEAANYSRFCQRIRRRYPQERTLLDAGLPQRPAIESLINALNRQGYDTGASLRIARQLVLERLATLDCEQSLGVQDVTAAMTTLAEVTLEAAYHLSHAELVARHGIPQHAHGQPAQLCIIGMGKLGARELNVSSDIDLIYVYDFDGETTGTSQGAGQISNQEFFGKQVRAIQTLIGDTTEHGFVFRVDLALRPNGNSGPPAVSMAALEEYFYTQGREWERFAWLKSRVIAPQQAITAPCAQSLRHAVVPFVFRKYLDYSVFDALRVLHRQIREHAARRSAGHPERSYDVKLSRGGIREIEFTVQLLQVVRGGQFPELRTRPTVSALQRLTQAGLMPAATADALAAAYTFLRQVEHRIQYLDDQQTHVLPTSDADVHWIATSLGFTDSCAFLAALDTHRECVAQEFDALLGGAQAPCKNCPPGDPQAPINDFQSVIDQLHGSFAERVRQWQDQPRITSLRDSARTRLARLAIRTDQWVQSGETTEAAALRWLDWVEPLLRRENYLALLLERPHVHERLLRLLGAARWPARYLLQHPGVIDELAHSAILQERFDPAVFEAELERRRQALAGTSEDDDETLLNILRRAHHAEVFRTLTRDVEGVLTVEQVADDLSALAESVLRVTTRWCWQRLKNRHREEPLFAILGYGKLGGKELGYGSDLDLVFVYDDPDEQAPEMYAALVRKLINWLTAKTSEGDLYEIDTALRPNGGSGLLVSHIDAYAKYQLQRGSNTAWTWEHQAITRARCVLGSDTMRQRFDAVRDAVLSTPRDAASLRQEILSMRNKMRASHRERPEQFDLKHSPGGMVDIEFAVQLLVLTHSPDHPSLRDNVGNIALLQRAQACGLLAPPIGEAAADAYRTLRHLQHQARLNEDPPYVPGQRVSPEQAAGQALWLALFNSTSAP